MAKFKKGDRVCFIGDVDDHKLFWCIESLDDDIDKYNNVFTIDEISITNGIEIYTVVENNQWKFRDHELTLFKNKIDNKIKLETGDIVTLRNGEKLVYLKDNDEFIDLDYDNENTIGNLDSINGDFEHGYDRDYDIVNIIRPEKYETIYIREERKEVKKMTVAEICEALGYEIEIIKEDK